jgi:hypothetical protein
MAGAFEESDAKSTISHLPAEKFRQYRFAFPVLGEQISIVRHIEEKSARLDSCCVPRDHIPPRSYALFEARSVLHAAFHDRKPEANP